MRYATGRSVGSPTVISDQEQMDAVFHKRARQTHGCNADGHHAQRWWRQQFWLAATTQIERPGGQEFGLGSPVAKNVDSFNFKLLVGTVSVSCISC